MRCTVSMMRTLRGSKGRRERKLSSLAAPVSVHLVHYWHLQRSDKDVYYLVFLEYEVELRAWMKHGGPVGFWYL